MHGKKPSKAVKSLCATLRQLATPIDFDGLIRRGVLKAAARGWHEALDLPALPEHAWSQIIEMKQTRNGRCLLKFGSKTNAEAAALYEHLTGEPFSPDQATGRRPKK